MGVVYRGYDRAHVRDVAIKTVRVPSAEALRRLKGEFRVAREVVHPNLVALYELCANGLDVLFSMELVLGQRLGQTRPDDPALRDRLVQLCGGIQALHDAGLVHGDLKPDNVHHVQPDGRVVLLNFRLFSMALAPTDDGLLAHGVKAPDRVRRWLAGPP